MSEKFYHKFLSLFSNFIILLVLIIASLQIFLVYASNQNMIWYVSYCVIIAFSIIYAIKYYLDFKNFKENLYLFIPNIPNNEDKHEEIEEPLNIDIDDMDTSLKVCLDYQRGKGFPHIYKALGLKHPETARRELRKGLNFLLRFYNENKERVKTNDPNIS